MKIKMKSFKKTKKGLSKRTTLGFSKKTILGSANLRCLIVLLISTIYLSTSIFMGDVMAVQQTIIVNDMSVSDWKGVPAFNDSYGDVQGVGPNDLVKLWVTSDALNIYCRWDVILTGTKTSVTSAAYSLALSSVPNSSTTRPAIEARAYVDFDAKGVATVSIANSAKTITLTPSATYVQQISAGTVKTLVSIEAKFPFASFNGNAITVNPLGPTSLFPLWGESLASASFNSVVKDSVPDFGFLNYDAVNAISTPKGTGPIANVTATAGNPYALPGSTVNYTILVKNVGDATGNPNLLFNNVQWILPAGFTYKAGTTTGLYSANPTVSGSTLTWAGLIGSLAPGATATINFQATAPSSGGTYYSDAIVTAQTPNVTYDSGDSAMVIVDAKYIVPGTPVLNTASNTTQTATTLSWSASTNAVTYTLYDNGIEIANQISGTNYTVTGLASGSTHLYTVKAISTWQVESMPSNAVSVTTLSSFSVTINPLLTNDSTPVITGTTTAPNGSTISLIINAKTYTGTVTGGTWAITVTDALADNTYSAQASVLNAISNTATASITVDTIKPTITIDSQTTQDQTPVITGISNAPNGSVVTLTINAKQYTGTVSNGTYSITVTDLLPYATYEMSASVSDIAGNIETATGSIEVAYLATLVEGVTLNKTTATMYVFDTLDLNETISPSNADNKIVTWTSSDENVAVVDETGKVTAVAEGNATITVTTQDGSKTASCDVTVKKPTAVVSIVDGDKLKISIYGANYNYSYQIWTYQTVTSDIFLNDSPNVSANQWILSSEYAHASTAVQEEDGSISFVIDLPANPPEGNYVISVKIKDEDGNFMGELKDSFTPETMGIVLISRVLVDGEKSFSNETKEIKPGASVQLDIHASNANSYSITSNGNILLAPSANNTFRWDISGELPGTYTLVFKANNTVSGSSFTKTITFTLYKNDPTINYGIITSLSHISKVVNGKNAIEIQPQLLNGDQFYYTMGEPGRAPLISSGYLAKADKYDQIMDYKRIGVFNLFGYIKRSSSASYDDGFVKTIVASRGQGAITLDYFLDDVNINNTTSVTRDKNTEMNFSAQATIGNLEASQIQYSYWRYDAIGWVLIKDWSTSNSLRWSPARPGLYNIQVRAKGEDAGSYEITRNIDVDVSSSEIAKDITLSVNTIYLNANARARVPIVITADATAANGDPLLYKFYISDDNLGTTQMQQYSPIQSCQWIPRKAGTYKISVLIKNSASFGKFDMSQSYTVVVGE